MKNQEKNRFQNHKINFYVIITLSVILTTFFLALGIYKHSTDDQKVNNSIDINNLDISFKGDKKWLLLGNEFTQTEQTLLLILNIENKIKNDIIPTSDWVVSLIIDSNEITDTFTTNSDSTYSFHLNVDILKPGTHIVKAKINFGSHTIISPAYTFNVSYPVYVNWTQDWEGLDVDEQYLTDIAAIADNHKIPLTHFFNPRIFATDTIPKERAQYLTNWVLTRRDNNGDDIGLHLHMFQDMILAAGVDPIENPIRWGSPIEGGYDILTSNYSQYDMEKLLNWSKKIFELNGLGTPIMFRAGGWYADEKTLTALENTGFVLDSSGRTAYTFGRNSIEGHWNLDTTTQPYKMNKTNQNIIDNPTINLWEFPNNGADSYKYSTQQLIDRFYLNYDKNPQTKKRVINFLSHPHWFRIDKPKIDALFNEIDKNLYRSDNGPVIYTTLSSTYGFLTFQPISLEK